MTQLEQLFNSFCCNHDPISRPFVDEGVVYATDRHVLIYAPESVLDFQAQPAGRGTPNAESIIKPFNTCKVLNVKSEDFETFKFEGSANAPKTFHERHYTKLDGAYFTTIYFYKLFEVQKVVGGEILLVRGGKHNEAHFFRIGSLSVVLMPVMRGVVKEYGVGVFDVTEKLS